MCVCACVRAAGEGAETTRTAGGKGTESHAPLAPPPGGLRSNAQHSTCFCVKFSKVRRIAIALTLENFTYHITYTYAQHSTYSHDWFRGVSWCHFWSVWRLSICTRACRGQCIYTEVWRYQDMGMLVYGYIDVWID